jgi:cytidylate kinase
LLKECPGVLHVRITAPFATRVERIVDRLGTDEIDAERLLKQKDRDSSGYIRSFFEADWDEKDLYDLAINTGTISMVTAIELII